MSQHTTPQIPTQFSPFTYAQPTWRDRISRPVAALASAVVLAVGGAGALGFQLHATQQHLSASTAQVRTLTGERDGLREDLAESDADLEGARKDLKSAKEELSATTAQLSQAQTSLADARQQVNGLKATTADMRVCLLSWLDAMGARNHDDYDGALAYIEAGKAACDRGAEELRQYNPDAVGGGSSSGV